MCGVVDLSAELVRPPDRFSPLVLPTRRRWKQEDQKFKVLATYKVWGQTELQEILERKTVGRRGSGKRGKGKGEEVRWERRREKGGRQRRGTGRLGGLEERIWD